MTPTEELAAQRRAIVKLRRERDDARKDYDRAEDLIKVMATNLAKRAREVAELKKEIAELKQKIYDVTVLD